MGISRTNSYTLGKKELVSAGSFFLLLLAGGKEGTSFGLRDFFIIKWTMFTAISTTVSTVQVVLCGKYHIAVFVIIKINMLLQWLHLQLALSRAS